MDNDGANQRKRNRTSVFLVVLVLCAAVAVGVFLRRGRGKQQPAAVKAVLHLETFTVNLSDPEQKAYLRLGVDLGLEREAQSAKDTAETPVALVRDSILTILMATRPEDLATPEGKQKLKSQLLQTLQQRAPGLGVHEIYFTEFLMQQ